MVKNTKKNSKNDPFGLRTIIDTIDASELADAKKILYLYMIAEGSFSLQTLEDLEKDLAELAKPAQKALLSQEKKVAGFEDELQNINRELDSLAVERCEDLQKRAEAFLSHASKTEEGQREKKHQKTLEAIYKKLAR